MSEELEQLRELVQQLKADKERLLQEQTSSPEDIPGPSIPSRSVSSERLLYLPRERKCPIFRGTMGIGINEWIEEVRASMRARYLRPMDEAFFIFDHLEGEAKAEIKYRTRAEREDPEQVFIILKELYGCSQSYVALQENFFSRKQLEGESLQEYSHALFSLMDKIRQSAPNGMPNADVLVRDQFAEHINDSALRRELKRVVRQNPESSMLHVRAEAIRWEREGMPTEVRGRSYSVPSSYAIQSSRVQGRADHSPGSPVAPEMAELRAMLQKQQEQINQLTRSVLAMQVPSSNFGSSRLNTVICRRCQKPGHYAKDCDNERVASRAYTPVVRTPQTEATTTSQPAEN